MVLIYPNAKALPKCRDKLFEGGKGDVSLR
jgi:hypothetical protein